MLGQRSSAIGPSKISLWRTRVPPFSVASRMKICSALNTPPGAWLSQRSSRAPTMRVMVGVTSRSGTLGWRSVPTTRCPTVVRPRSAGKAGFHSG
ncbi:hypothetical protein AJ88_31730 [Mesorhizobium amorphae CCBAU 01583]|nr:hypothetical protein AJ88_31730 [Mesorhizobium amorphae CCBAU 01583]